MRFHVAEGAAAIPCCIRWVLVRFWVEPGGRGEVSEEVSGGGCVFVEAAAAVAVVHEQEGEEERCEEDRGEDYSADYGFLGLLIGVWEL